jgi:hypothetical protein
VQALLVLVGAVLAEHALDCNHSQHWG